MESAIICCEPTGVCHTQSSPHGRSNPPSRKTRIHWNVSPMYSTQACVWLPSASLIL